MNVTITPGALLGAIVVGTLAGLSTFFAVFAATTDVQPLVSAAGGAFVSAAAGALGLTLYNGRVAAPSAEPEVIGDGKGQL